MFIFSLASYVIVTIAFTRSQHKEFTIALDGLFAERVCDPVLRNATTAAPSRRGTKICFDKPFGLMNGSFDAPSDGES